MQNVKTLANIMALTHFNILPYINQPSNHRYLFSCPTQICHEASYKVTLKGCQVLWSLPFVLPDPQSKPVWRVVCLDRFIIPLSTYVSS